jgi:hypothetical protein
MSYQDAFCARDSSHEPRHTIKFLLFLLLFLGCSFLSQLSDRPKYHLDGVLPSSDRPLLLQKDCLSRL